jgi:fluoride exporter
VTSARLLGAVALGGAVGTLLRAGGLWAFGMPTGGFPWVTLAENLVGALLLGWATGVVLRRRPEDRVLHLFLGAGVLGSFTTFSALAVDVVLLGSTVGAVYLALSLGGGLAAAAAGVWLGRAGTPGSGV